MLGLGVFATAALGHAKLVESRPKAGQVLERSPRTVLLVFDEAIDAEFVQLQVQDSAGRRVDRAAPYHPGGREERLAVRLRPTLSGRYVASYRVISEDGHPVVKRITFRVRPPMSTGEEEQREPVPPGRAPMPGDDAGHLETGGVTDTRSRSPAASAISRSRWRLVGSSSCSSSGCPRSGLTRAVARAG
jgi:copper resistance protein C